MSLFMSFVHDQIVRGRSKKVFLDVHNANFDTILSEVFGGYNEIALYDLTLADATDDFNNRQEFRYALDLFREPGRNLWEWENSAYVVCTSSVTFASVLEVARKRGFVKGRRGFYGLQSSAAHGKSLFGEIESSPSPARMFSKEGGIPVFVL